MANTVPYLQQSGNGPSPSIWRHLDVLRLLEQGPEYGLFFHDDFTGFSGTVASNVGTYRGDNGGYKTFEDTSCSIAPLATEATGVIALVTDATDNNEVNMQRGNTGQVCTNLTLTAGAKAKVLFEARIRLSQVTNTYNFFVGLTEESLAVTDGLFTDAAAFTDKDYVGFFLGEAAGSSLKFGYNKAGGSDQVAYTYGTALTDSTWYKVGFVFDPTAADSQRLRSFVNNVEQTAVADSAVQGANFPLGEEMTFFTVLKNGAAAAKGAQIDWIRLATVFVAE